jgi:cytochrome P450
MYPEVLKKAHEEVDRVVGTGRLPTLADRDNLPYIDAIVKEVLRWNVVVPTGI